MSDTKVSTKVWRHAGPGNAAGDIIADAFLELKSEGKIPQAVLPEPAIIDAKKGKKDKEDGTWFTVEFSFRKPTDHESTVTADEIIQGMQTAPFDPEHNDEP